jgi:hypothetical protein
MAQAAAVRLSNRGSRGVDGGRRKPFQNTKEIADERFPVLRSVHAINGLLGLLGGVGVGGVVVGRFALPLGGGID